MHLVLINTIRLSSILGGDFVGGEMVSIGGELTRYIWFMFTWETHLDGRYMKR